MTKAPAYWMKKLDDRQQKEVTFSRAYVRDYNHGTDGHNAKVIIAVLSEELDQVHVERIERLQGKSPEQWAQDAYNRYFVSAGGKNFSGGDMPSWDELPEAIQQHWVAAIEGVI